MSKLFIPVLGGAALGLIGIGMVVSSLTAGAVRASSSSANAMPTAAADRAPASASDSLAFMMIPPQGERIDAFLRLLARALSWQCRVRPTLLQHPDANLTRG